MSGDGVEVKMAQGTDEGSVGVKMGQGTIAEGWCRGEDAKV